MKSPRPAKETNPLKGFKAVQIAMRQQKVGLYSLKTTEFIAGDETLMNHRENRRMSLKQTGSGLVNTGDQSKKRALTSTVVTDQRNALAFVNGTFDVLQCGHYSTTALAPK